MPPFVQSAIDQVGAFWTGRSAAQRILIAGLATSVLVAFALMIYWLNKPDYRVLYSKMYPEDASRVVEMLKGMKEPYQLEDNGATVMVPAERVYDLRLKVAGEGQLKGQGVGFEIFDEIKVGQTDFVQRINYQRALQGELARTIQEFPEVDKARVHLVLPHKSLFIEEQSPPSASIVLTLKQNQKLEQKQLQGIVNLVTLSIEGLDKGKVTISDTAGKLLYQPSSESSLEGVTSAQLGYKQTIEQSMQQRIENMLAPLIGPGKVIARVNADVDFSHKTIRKEIFDPQNSVVRSEQRSEESTRGRANVDGGAPDPNFRGDGINGTATQQDGSRENRTTNYEINREEQQIVAPVGDLKRLTVAVVVDGVYAPGADGKNFAFTPRSDQELERIKTLVQNAVGFQEGRGDAVEVNSISFGGPDLYAEPSLAQNMLEYAQRLGKPFLNGVLVFLFLLLVVRPVVMALIRPRVAEEEIEELAGLPEGEDRLALMEPEEDETMESQRRFEAQRSLALQLSEQDMDQALGVIKIWLKQGEPVSA